MSSIKYIGDNGVIVHIETDLDPDLESTHGSGSSPITKKV